MSLGIGFSVNYLVNAVDVGGTTANVSQMSFLPYHCATKCFFNIALASSKNDVGNDSHAHFFSCM